MNILISAFALLTGPAGHPLPHGEEIFVRTDRTVTVEKLASAIRPMGRLESRERGSSVFLIELNPGVEDDRAKVVLARVPGVHLLSPQEEPVDMHSLRSLDRKIAHLSAEERDERTVGTSKGAVQKEDEVDYLKAYRYFVGQRAFPNDQVDWNALSRGQVHAAQMQPTAIGWSGVGVKPFTVPTWQFVGPSNLAVPYQEYYGFSPVNGRINCVAYDPNNSQTIYAGAAQGGLWTSPDGGTTWNWLSSTWTQLAVNQVVIDPTNTSTIYAARGDYHGMIAGSCGIMKSMNGGSSWTELGTAGMMQTGVASLMMDPTSSQTLIAGTGDANSYGFLYRSTNGGTSWTVVGPSGNDFLWGALSSSVLSSGKIRFYAVAAGYARSTGASSRVYKSDDHGATWQLLPSPVVADGNFHWAYAIAASPTNPNNVYVLDSENQALYTSANQGSTWTNKSASLPSGTDSGTANYNFSQSYYDYHLDCGSRVAGSATEDVLYLGEIDISESVDGGTTWKSLGGPTYAQNAITHNDQHSLAVCPTNPNLALFTNDGGIYSLTYTPASGLNSIKPLNKNLGISMFYKIALHPTNASYILGGTQDNASPLSTGNLLDWSNVGGGDGGGCAINQTNPLIQYTTSEGLSIYRTTDGWNSEIQFTAPTLSTETLPFVAPLVLDPQSQMTMYTATNFLYQWNETTQTWASRLGNQDLTGQTAGANVQTIAVAPTDSNRIYTGSSNGILYMTADQGSTWKKIFPTSGSSASQAITSISVSSTNPSDILVGVSGTGQSNPHLYRCQNTTASTPAFASVSGTGTTGLPDVSLNAIARDLDNPGTTWWVAMDAGVFQTSNSGQTWTNAGASSGLPNVIVDDLVAVPGTRFLNAGTYGRGFWRLNLPVQSKSPSLEAMTLSPTTIPVGGTSTGTVTISTAAPSGGLAVLLKSSATAVATVPSSVVVSEGATTATFAVTASSTLTANESAVITASYNGVSFTQDLAVSVPALTAISIDPTSLLGGNSATGTVTLNVPAPAAGTKVTLASSSIDAKAPASITVPSGATSANFTISTTAVTVSTTATITARHGTVAKTAKLTVKPNSVQSLVLSQETVIGGSQVAVIGTVTLISAAPSIGAKVTLSSSRPTAAEVPLSVTVPAGATSATFTITHLKVAVTTSAVIKATCGGVSVTATLSVNPFLVTSLVLTPTTVVGGTSVTGTVTLNAVAGTGSKAVSVRMTSSVAAAVPPVSVSVPIGSSTATFTIKTKGVAKTTVATITASIGTSGQKATVTLLPPSLASISILPSPVTGSALTVVTGTAAITSPAPIGGFAIMLKSSDTPVVSVPPYVSILTGRLTASFRLTHRKVLTSTLVTITGTRAGMSQSATLRVNP